MNHIKYLQTEKETLEKVKHATIQEIIDFRAHLQSSKFTTPSQDGSRVDWISTTDVDQRLLNLLETLRGFNLQ